jgi:hypothetical protein
LRIGTHDHAHHVASDLQDVGQVVDRMVGELFVEQRLAQHAHVHLGDDVAVGLGVLQRHRTHDARRAGLVVDHDLLAKLPGDRLRQDAKARIRRTAGSPRDDQPDRPVGEACLGARGDADGKGRGRRCGQQSAAGKAEGGGCCRGVLAMHAAKVEFLGGMVLGNSRRAFRAAVEKYSHNSQLTSLRTNSPK